MNPPIPINETARLEALREYDILDSVAEKAYDDITQLVAHICDVPYATISFVDADRQWFKSQIGMPTQETSRDIAFCAHTINDDKLFIVSDAAADDRFAKNPLVTSEPSIRFYAGAPLLTKDNHALGSLCAIDRVPRELTAAQKTALEALSRQVMLQLELRRSLAEGRRAAAMIEDLNADLKRRNEELATVNRELEAFSHAVSHDLRSPIFVIQGFAGVLRDSVGGLGDDARHGIDRILSNCKRMTQLIEDLLNFSRAGYASLNRESVDLSALAAEIVENLRGANPDRAVEFEIEPELRAEADPNLVRVVLENLIGNAWKYTGKTEAPEIRLGVRRDDVLVVSNSLSRSDANPVFVLRDNGAGFDMAMAHKLFHTFQRLHSASEFPGTGVGLATVKRIIDRHGGQIWADSTPGAGAVFHFTLGSPAE